MIERLLRLVAFVIAVAGVIDPSWTLERPVTPVVALHVGPGGDATAELVRRAMSDGFVLVKGPVAAADARIVIGRNLPPAADAPTFVLVEESTGILAVEAPARAPLDARVPVRVTLDLEGSVSEGAADVVRLVIDGLTADERPVEAFAPLPGGLATATLMFTPSGTDPHHVRVALGDQYIDTLVSLDDAPWRVVAYDPRPSWSATFVRRALERDPRFALAARIDTSPQDGVASGSPPALGDLAALDEVDAIVVGAPDALDAATVEVLRRFLRWRGGSVVMLIDREPGAAADLAGLADWSARMTPNPSLLRGSTASPVQRGSDATTVLRASEIALPQRLPAAGRTLAGIGEGPDSQPVVWQAPIGRGRLVVSGALDAWRFRAADEARFDRFWRDVIADAAAAAAVPLELEIGFRVGQPGRRVPIEVTVRDLALDPDAAGIARVAARLEGGSGATNVRLWPAEAGRFRGHARLPQAPGPYRLVVESDGARADADLLVRDDAVSAPSVPRAHLTTWATAQGGAVIPASQIDQLPGAIRAAVDTGSISVVIHPMRSGWWMVPFALALGAEWWLRRRRRSR